MVKDNVIRIFVKNNNVLIQCPACEKKKYIDVGKYQNRDVRLKVKCNCKNAFRIKLIFPQASVNVQQSRGQICNLSQNSKRSDVTIIHLTGTSVNLRVLGANLPRKGDKISFEYTDSNSFRKISKKATVKRVQARIIYCFFTR